MNKKQMIEEINAQLQFFDFYTLAAILEALKKLKGGKTACINAKFKKC